MKQIPFVWWRHRCPVARLRVVLPLCAGALWSCASPPPGTADQPGGGGATEVAAAGHAPVGSAGGEVRLRGLDDLLVLARERHPELAALRQRAAGLAERPAQNEALPYPMVMTSVGGMEESAASQMIPFPGKRRSAAEGSRREAEAAARDVAAMELRVEQQVRSAWWDLWLAEESARLHRDGIEMLGALRETVDARVAADRARQVDQVRLGNEIAMLEKELVETERLTATARARLNQLMNRDPRAPLPTPPAAGPVVPSVAGMDRLLDQALKAHPELGAAELRRRAADHRLERARLEGWPDFNVGALVETGSSSMASGSDRWSATFGMSVPLWREPRRAMVREAEAGRGEAESQLATARSDLGFRVVEAHAEAIAASRVAGLFEERLIPDSGRAHELSVTAYAAGESDFTEVIQTWQEQLGYRLLHAGARARAAAADAALRAVANTSPTP